MIVFGGGGVSNETWALSLSGDPTWQKLQPAGPLPPARREHAAAYDPVGRRMLIFGGITFGYANDVWALSLDGTPTWQEVTVAGPPPRARQSPVAVYDASNSRMIVHGGYDGTNLIRDAWELSFVGRPAWRQLEPAGNPPVFWFNHSAVVEPARQRMVIYGDFGSWSLDWSEMAPGRAASTHPSAAAAGAAPAALSIAVGPGTPQPVRGAWDVQVYFPETGRAVLEVRSVAGRLLVTQELHPTATGTAVFRVAEPLRLSAGVYFLRIVQGRRQTITKLVVLH
jgi:hypothetical protein